MSNILISSNNLNIDARINSIKIASELLNIDARINNVKISGLCIQVEFYEPEEMGDPSALDLSYTKLIKGTNVVAEIKELQGVNVEGNLLDVTTLNENDFWRKYIYNLKDCTDVVASGFFTLTDLKGQTAIFNDFQDGSLDVYTIEFPSSVGGTWLFFAFVRAYDTGVVIDDAVQWMSSLKIVGQAVLGTEASAGVDSVKFVRASDLGTLDGDGCFPPFNPDSQNYTVKFTNDSIKFYVTATNPHYVAWYIDDVYQGLLELDTLTDAINFEVNESIKISFKMWQDNRSPLYYDFVLVRTV